MLNNFDKAVRFQIYNYFVEKGSAPSISLIAEELNSPASEVRNSYQRLVEGRALVLQSNDEILMAEPFSAVLTAFQVFVGEQWWWGNCIWDALGIIAMLDRDGYLISSCGCCSHAMRLDIKDRSLLDSSGIIHFALPVKDWWKNIVFT
jgi:hypothetical protein